MHEVDRRVIFARATGTAKRDRTIRVARYVQSWEVMLGIGHRDPAAPAKAAAMLFPAEARQLAHELLTAAELAEGAQAAAAAS